MKELCFAEYADCNIQFEDSKYFIYILNQMQFLESLSIERVMPFTEGGSIFRKLKIESLKRVSLCKCENIQGGFLLKKRTFKDY